MKGKSLGRVRLLATPWSAAYQAPPSMGFSRQEYWSGVLLPSPEGPESGAIGAKGLQVPGRTTQTRYPGSQAEATEQVFGQRDLLVPWDTGGVGQTVRFHRGSEAASVS